MRRVQEVIYLTPDKKEAFLNYHLNPSEEQKKVMWVHGIRNQFYYAMNDLILLTFEYVGSHFREDMAELAAYYDEKGFLVETRRKNVPTDMMMSTCWWAPLKNLGATSIENPLPDDENSEKQFSEQYHELISGFMTNEEITSDMAFDDDDWSESVHI